MFALSGVARLGVLFALLLGFLACQGAPEPFETQPQSIIGGKADNRYPAIGVLTVNKKGQFCTATLVAPQLVLTAAHCVASARSHIKAKRKIFFRMDGATQSFHEVKDTFTHPQYKRDSTGIYHDMGALSLVAKVTEPPMPLNASPMDSAWVNRKILFLGYGLIQTLPKRVGTTKKQGAEIPIRRVTTDRFETYAKGVSICSGDSGGPGLYKIGSAYKVVGVNSYVQGTQSGNNPNCDGSGYSFRVDVYFSWLQPLLNQYGYTCKNNADCGPCFQCSGGTCKSQNIAKSSSFCKPCRSPSDCGGGNDICVRTSQGNRCMQACASGDCCPTGTACTTFGIGAKQCAPPKVECPPVACTKDADCGPAEACQNKLCKPKPPTPHAKLCKPCKSHSDCPTNGSCVPYTDGGYCSQACAGDLFCPAGYTCTSVNGVNARQCLPTAGVCKCAVNADCHAPFQCTSGRCSLPGGGKTGQPCDASQHPCAKGLFCLHTEQGGRCARPCSATTDYPTGTPGSLCRSRRYCDMGSRCFAIQGGNQACMQPCTHDKDCTLGGKCYPQGSRSFCFCRADGECKNGSTCNKGVFKSAGLCAFKWTKQACPQGETCAAITNANDTKVCLPQGTLKAGDLCSPVIACGPGLVCLQTNSLKSYCFPQCSSGSCGAAGGSCVTASGFKACICNGGVRCNKGHYCKITEGNGGVCFKGVAPSCTQEWECPTGEVCQKNACIPDPNPPCKTTLDCGSGKYCKGGRCRDIPPQEPRSEPSQEPRSSEPTAEPGASEPSREPSTQEPRAEPTLRTEPTPPDASAGQDAPGPSPEPSRPVPDDEAADTPATPDTHGPKPPSVCGCSSHNAPTPPLPLWLAMLGLLPMLLRNKS